MIAVLSTLMVLAASIVVIRIATVGLTMTGVSKDLAQFQALSAFTGSGFTTQESEDIVNHPIRRRIVMHLMLIGHIGVVVAIPSLILSFLNTQGNDDFNSQLMIRLVVLSGGMLTLFLIASSKHVEDIMWQANRWALERWGVVHIHDYTKLLRVARDYVISELHVRQHDWLAGHTLEQLRLASEGVLVLGIEKSNGNYVGAPRGHTRLEDGDCLILYGQQQSILNLDDRRTGWEGNVEHVMAVTRQMDVIDQELEIDAPRDGRAPERSSNSPSAE